MGMRTYPIQEAGDVKPFAFEIEHAYVGTAALVRILEQVPGVTHVDRKSPKATSSDIRVSFRFCEQLYVVWEPRTDNTRYRIGPVHPHASSAMVTVVEDAFKKYRSPLLRKLYCRLKRLRRRSTASSL